MNGVRRPIWIFVALAALAHFPASAEDRPSGSIRIVDQPGTFESIQAAIDAAPRNAVIEIGAGRYDERLRITKPMKLVGAGPHQTVIGPTAEMRKAQENALLARVKEIESGIKSSPPPTDPQRAREEFETLSAAFNTAIISIDGVQGIELRSLRITSPGTPRARMGLSGPPAIELNNGGLAMVNCAVVGCLGDGVHSAGGSDLDISDCLIAGCWSSGVSMMNRSPGRLRIVNSDVRNCYHNNIWTGSESNPCTIEGCRISGSAWFGIRFGDRRPTIERNAIFENARSGIYAEGEGGVIKQNLIYKNALGGAACFYHSQDVFEGNLFLDNGGVGIYITGACEPTVRRNVFIASAIAALYGPIETEQVNLQPLDKFHVMENLFWKVDEAVVRRYLAKGASAMRDEAIELPADAGNRFADPQVSLGPEQQVVLDANSPARKFDVAGLTTVSLKSRWPLTDEERAMIPADGTRDWSKWKMKPK